MLSRYVWILLFLIAASAAGELTPEDLQAIESIVKEEIKESEERTNLKFATVYAKIDGMEKSLIAKIDGVGKSLSFLWLLVIALIAIFASGFFYAIKKFHKAEVAAQANMESNEEVMKAIRAIESDDKLGLREMLPTLNQR